MRKIGIRTVYNINNYGSSLQAYALSSIIQEQGFFPVIIEESRQGLEKIIRKGFRGIKFILTGLFHKDAFEQYIKIKNSINRVSEKTKKLFQEFNQKHFYVESFPYSKLKKIATSDDYCAFICGSDQVWGVAGPYIPPINFLKFAPQNKRIAYAPSFGVSNIPHYKIRTIKKFLNGFDKISIREQEGARIIKQLTGKQAVVALDPTLLVDKNFWNQVAEKNDINKPYILCYFLNAPSPKVIEYIRLIKEELNIDILFLPYPHPKLQEIGRQVEVSPFGFLDLVNRASFMLTDSFHGVAFAINLNVPFLVFERQYGHDFNQSSRIFSILNITKLQNRWIDKDTVFNKKMLELDFRQANNLLETERQKSYDFLIEAIKAVGR